MAGGLIIALALITGLALPSFGVTPTPVDPQPRDIAGTQLAIQEGGLLEPGETAEYDTSPPTSGPSWAEAAAWGVSSATILASPSTPGPVRWPKASLTAGFRVILRTFRESGYVEM